MCVKRGRGDGWRIDSPIMSESSDPCHSAEAPTRMASRIARAITPIAQSNTVMRGHIESWRESVGGEKQGMRIFTHQDQR